ncbi:smoothelin-like protein 2 isoform X3 [Hippocampus comes]|uniref:smoothelin-like protein 2 isoform X3 n=1 Tax=Hippocampus comes TaxID=109280 RepID=UPI00094F33C1|nr:PREDICTED: smoothelin-like protein 2 isoform X3 [Hippocampus comes]
MDQGAKGAEEKMVSKALVEFNDTLQAAVREVHMDVSAFKQRIEQRIEEMSASSGPLAEAVGRLQEENLQLHSKLEALSRLVESLAGVQIDRNFPTTMSKGKNKEQGAENGLLEMQSRNREGQRCPVGLATSGSLPPWKTKEINGMGAQAERHIASVEHQSRKQVQEKFDSPTEHHPPITAMTRVSSEAHSAHSAAPMAKAATETATKSFKNISAPVLKTPSPILKRSVSFPQPAEKLLPSKSVIKPGFSSGFEKKANSPPVECKQEPTKSNTLPRAGGAQAKRALFERMNSDPVKPKDSKPKLKRSQSFGVTSASGIKNILLEWCRSKTIGYQNIDIQNFSSSWSDGMAFCALVHSFFPLEFDYNTLKPANRKQNLQLAFSTAETQADCLRLIEVDDMLEMGDKPDPMCVFTYVQSL